MAPNGWDSVGIVMMMIAGSGVRHHHKVNTTLYQMGRGNFGLMCRGGQSFSPKNLSKIFLAH